MEALSRSEKVLPPEVARRVLLLDCNDRRRKTRADALIKRGAMVDSAAETIAARILWKPGAYDLLLIDLRGVDADCTAFISFVLRAYGTQRFGYYMEQPPYVTASASECRSSMQQKTSPDPADPRPQSVGTADRGGNNLSVAARQIAAFKQGVRIRLEAQVAQEPPDLAIVETPSVSAADALKIASRILGSS